MLPVMQRVIDTEGFTPVYGRGGGRGRRGSSSGCGKLVMRAVVCAKATTRSVRSNHSVREARGAAGPAVMGPARRGGFGPGPGGEEEVDDTPRAGLGGSGEERVSWPRTWEKEERGHTAEGGSS